MKYFFVLGRNPELSRAEIFSYLDSRDVGFEQNIYDGNLLVLNLDKEFNLDIQQFGGVLKLGKIDFFGSDGEFEVYLAKEDLVPSDKFSYSVFGNFGEDNLKDKFKMEKRKAMMRHGRNRIKFQDEGSEGLPKADFYFFCFAEEWQVYFGVVEQEFDDFGVRKRDMKKPHRREELAISPRLARILVNLSGARNRFFDCFCGVGGVLQEALISEIDCIGVDKDSKAVGQARVNLGWMRKNFGFKANYGVIGGDSRTISKEKVGEFDGVGAETALGELVKKKLGKKEAKKFIEGFEDFIIPILKNLKKLKPENAKIAMTFPVVGEFHTDISGISQRAGLRILDKFSHFGVKFPILESRPGQFISRDFVVFY